MSDRERAIDLLDDLRAFADTLGETPTKAQMNDRGPHSTTPYYTAFGSWNDALEAAGLEPNHRNNVSDEELQAELRRLDAEIDGPVLWEDMESRGAYSPHTYARRWDTWLAAREAAGLEGEEVHTTRRISREDLIAALRKLALELGRPPAQTDMNEQGAYSVRPYYREFGSWRDALETAGVAGEREVSPPRDTDT